MTELLTRGCQPLAEEGQSLLEKAAKQGHAYAMNAMRGIHIVRKEYEQAVKWGIKGAEAGLPKAMFNYGVSLEKGQGVAAPDYLMAAERYCRAAESGHAGAAINLSNLYTFGRGGSVRQCLPRHSHIVDPGFLRYMASRDAGSNIC